MEKKGKTLNQLAIITDLIEKINITYTSAKLIFNLNDDEFKNVYNYTARNTNEPFVPLKETAKSFTIVINNVEIEINKNNV